MISIAFYEDNEIHAKAIMDRLEKWSAKTGTPITIKHYDHAHDISMLSEFDCIFLDIELPDKNGLEIAREIRSRNIYSPIVFISSHTDYSLAGYEVSALRFIDKLDKSFDDKLFECMDAVSAKLNDRHQNYYSFKEGGKTISVPVSDIMYFEASNHTIIIHLVSRKHTERKRVSELANELPACFAKCSRSYIVNVMYIDVITNKNVRLTNGSAISVAKQYSESLYRTYLEYH